MSEAPELFTRVERTVGRFTLNRPAALHALTLAMCHEMIAALSAWRGDRNVHLVMIDHAGERGFCAGGDIRNLAAGHAGDGSPPWNFFYREYQLDHQLFTYDKPTLSIMDGVVMGGGVGIALPCRYRIATEKTTFAMPETGIGLFPDVGGGWYLSRLPGRAGYWMALTGARIKAADCLALGLATHFVPHERLEGFKASVIANPDAIEALLAEFAGDPGPAPIAENRTRIDALFAAHTVEGVVEALTADGSDWALAQLAILKTKSPTMSKVALRQLLTGAKAASFADNLVMEFRIAARSVPSPDFTEGVRATIIDRDNKPAWNPATIEGVTEADVDRFFAPMPKGQDWVPLEETA